MFEEIFFFRCFIFACNALACFCNAPTPHPQKFLTTGNPAIGLQLPASFLWSCYTIVAHYYFCHLMTLNPVREAPAVGLSPSKAVQWMNTRENLNTVSMEWFWNGLWRVILLKNVLKHLSGKVFNDQACPDCGPESIRPGHAAGFGGEEHQGRKSSRNRALRLAVGKVNPVWWVALRLTIDIATAGSLLIGWQSEAVIRRTI